MAVGKTLKQVLRQRFMKNVNKLKSYRHLQTVTLCNLGSNLKYVIKGMFMGFRAVAHKRLTCEIVGQEEVLIDLFNVKIEDRPTFHMMISHAS